MSLYRSEFEMALARAETLGLPRQTFVEGLLEVTEEHGLRLVKLAEEELSESGLLAPSDLAFRCGQASVQMAGHVRAVVGETPTLTLGSVTQEGQKLWGIAPDNLISALASGDFHVWLTTPNLEIIDFTLSVSLTVQAGRAGAPVQPIAGDPDRLRPFQWCPVIAGNDAVRALLRT